MLQNVFAVLWGELKVYCTGSELSKFMYHWQSGEERKVDKIKDKRTETKEGLMIRVVLSGYTNHCLQ